MRQTGSRNNQTDDPFRTPIEVPATEARRCWCCRRPCGPDTRILGGGTGAGHDGGTKVPYCSDGQGCRDGRVYHGPPWPSHGPEETCGGCALAGPTPAARRARSNSSRAVSRPGSRTNRFR
jgi:hypothetical protein